MRLIDADEFKKQIAGMSIVNNYPADKANKMCELIDCQPIAYDVDKVVEQLEEKILNTSDTQIGISARMAFGKSIEIVKSGGIE
ncbi:MAG: hypothetical protein HFH87_12815 [Lachnospiraceae bacterium]|nr:hypothetical protein [Lachnospiraceae bacterium]